MNKYFVSISALFVAVLIVGTAQFASAEGLDYDIGGGWDTDYGWADIYPDDNYGWADIYPDDNYGYADIYPDDNYGYADIYPDDDYGYADIYPDDNYGYADIYPDDNYGGYADVYDNQVRYDSACSCYSYGSGGSGGSGSMFGGRGFSSGGYSMVKPITFSPPSYTPAKPVGGGSNTNITNTNTNINNTNTNITNIDNSINDSFNNYNSNNMVIAQVTPVQQTPPQYPIVYQQPIHPAPYCVIRVAQAASSGVTAAYLSWTSTNASSAYLSNVGSVQVNGSQTVWPTMTTTYTLTVYGQSGQSNTCQVVVYANATVAPYVSLTQIPYTGFDFGTMGNAMYWVTLVSFALAAAYLAVYYRGGALAFAGAMVPKQNRAYAPIVAPKAPILIEREAKAEAIAPIIEKIRKAGTTDTMAIVQSRDGSMPRIVIERN